MQVKVNKNAGKDIKFYEMGVNQNDDSWENDIISLLGPRAQNIHRGQVEAKNINKHILARNMHTEIERDNQMLNGHRIKDLSIGNLEWKNEIIQDTWKENDYLHRALNQSLYDSGYNASRQRIAVAVNPFRGTIYNNDFIRTAAKKSNNVRSGYSKMPTTYFRQGRIDLSEQPRTLR
jgi:hypothetical protein